MRHRNVIISISQFDRHNNPLLIISFSMKLKKRFLGIIVLIFALFYFQNALADLLLNSGEIQLSVNGFTFTMAAGKYLKVRSADRRYLTFDPNTTGYTGRSCSLSESSATIDTGSMSGAGTINITVNVSSNVCTVEGGGDGSFLAGTKILIPTGTKNVEDVLIGDSVIGYD